jgi:hypothetical protein
VSPLGGFGLGVREGGQELPIHLYSVYIISLSNTKIVMLLTLPVLVMHRLARSRCFVSPGVRPARLGVSFALVGEDMMNS